MKTIVTHIGPDLDAITSVWIIKTFFPDWEEAQVAFVPAGTTMGKRPPDEDSEIMHVDTGFGQFDHHQSNADTCAAKLVYEELVKRAKPDTGLERMVAIVNDIDHFREVFYPDASADLWEFSLENQIDGWRLIHAEDPMKVVALGMDSLDAIHRMMKNKIWAEHELETGMTFETKWGKGIAFETLNDAVIHLAQKKGFVIAIRKDPNKNYLRVKALPIPEIDLTDAYNRLKDKDPGATWFLHASLHMILNGSTKNPDMKPTTLPMADIIEIVKEL